MTWDSVPWFVGGGAQHSPEIARLLAFAATGGAEGIVSPGDLKVSPLAVPGSSVRVLAGAALIRNRAAGGDEQTYVARNPSEDVVPIAATGSGAGRSDLIVARIEDPFMPGEPWADPQDVTKGPYIFTRVIPNVAPGTTKVPSGTSGIPLARIDIPANTATIDGTMVKDLRKLARPRSWQEYALQPGPAAGEYLYVTDTNWKNWPSNSLQVDVPDWATHALCSITLNTVDTNAVASDFNPRINFGGITVASAAWDYNGGDTSRGAENHAFTMYGTVNVQALQGQRVTVRPQAMRTFADWNQGVVVIGQWDQVIFDIRFQERVV